MTTKTAAATHLPLRTNYTGAETRGEDYPFFASGFPLTPFLADEVAFNVMEREQRASVEMEHRAAASVATQAFIAFQRPAAAACQDLEEPGGGVRS